MTSPDAKVEASANNTCTTVPPEEKSGRGGRSSSSSSSSSFTGTSGTDATSIGYKTTDAGGTNPEEVSGQDAAQDTERIEGGGGGGPAKTSGSSNEKRRSSSPTFQLGMSPPERRTNGGNKFKRRKMAAAAEAVAVNEEVQHASTSTTCISTQGEGVTSKSTDAAASTSNNAHASNDSAISTVHATSTTATTSVSTSSLHDVASSSSSTAARAAQAAQAPPAPPAPPAPAPAAVPPNSTANQYQQLQALVAQKREQLAAALLAQQQLSAISGLNNLSGAAASIGLGLGALGTAGTGTATSQASIYSAAVNLAQAQALVDAALSNSSRPTLNSISVDSALRSHLMGTMTSPLSSSPSRTLASQLVGSPIYNPLSMGLDLTAIATANAMLQQQAGLEYLQQLQAQRSLLSSISASSAAAPLSALAATPGLSSLNDAAILLQLQSGASRAGEGAFLSTSSSSVGLPSAASAVSPSPAAATAQWESQGHGQDRQGKGGGLGYTQEGMPVPATNGPRRISKAPPLPNITPAAAKAPANQRTTRSDGVVCLSSGLPHYTQRSIVTLSAPDDVHWLSTYLCFVRDKCAEVFEADEAEINGRSSSKLINIRQIGIRCRYCAHIHQRDRAGRSTSFPSSLSRIYQSLTMMLREHFTTCTEMPPAIRERFLTLKLQKTSGPDQDKRQLRGSNVSAKESRSYWVDSAKGIGLYDTELGIKRRTRSTAPAQASSGQGP